jgi:hypothetical protein
MNTARSTTIEARFFSLAALVAVLGLFGCNAILGIEAPTCVGACAGAASPGALDGGAVPLDGAAPPAASVDAGARPTPSGALLGEADAGLATDAGAPPCDPTGPCPGSVCLSGQRRCAGAALQVCNTPRTAFVLEEQCASAALCDGANATCGQALCAPDQRRCEGARLEVCNGDATAFVLEEQCASPGLCGVAGCLAPICAAGERRCSADVLEQCNAELTAFDIIQSCGSAALCNGPAARCNSCVPGARRCANGSTVAVCDPTGAVESTNECVPLIERCEAGDCVLIDIDLPI